MTLPVRCALPLLAVLLALPCCKRPARERLTIFHAGSLSVPFRELSALFQQRHPGVEVRAEAAGSRDTARKVSDLGRRCDVLGSADYKVVQNLLVTKHVRFNIRFSTNELVIAYGSRSRHAAEISSRNWHEVLLRGDVAFGRSDPNRDPCGYRSEMLFQLAERHYKRPGLAAKLRGKGGKRFIRPKETDLLALLESGEIDYLFIYRSVAVQHKLKIISLPEAINLRSSALANHYRTARVEVTGKRPGHHITREGEPIVYSVTMPTRALRPDLAEAYIALLLSPVGQALMKRNGQPPLTPPLVDGAAHLPASLKRFFEE
jgi:molybdate/tungstate transport system substrate-binding protein